MSVSHVNGERDLGTEIGAPRGGGGVRYYTTKNKMHLVKKGDYSLEISESHALIYRRRQGAGSRGAVGYMIT